MTGSVISIIVMTIAFALLAFVLAYMIFAKVSENQINADKRLNELKKKQGNAEEVSLIKNKSRKSLMDKKRRKQSTFFEKFGTALYKELQSANIKMRPEEFLTIWLLVSVLPAGLVVLFLSNATVAIVLLVLGLLLPVIILKSKQKKRVKQFDEQLADALIIACSCLKSGLSFTQAMETIAKDMDDPISSEFALVIAEMSMGATMEESLERLGERIKSQHLALMISAVLVQRQTGGNLSQILDNIAKAIKERMKMRQELKSATASGKMSGMMVGIMPVALLIMFSVVNFEFVKPLFTDSLGHIFLAISFGLDFLAFMLIKKITTVKM